MVEIPSIFRLSLPKRNVPFVSKIYKIYAVLVVFASKKNVNMLLVGCVAIDSTDIISAYLSGKAGLFGTADGWLLKLTSTAIAALILELGALLLIYIHKTPKNVYLKLPSQ